MSIVSIAERGLKIVVIPPGLVGVSAPVYWFRGDIIAAINVSAPKQRLGAHLDEAGKFTRSIADPRRPRRCHRTNTDSR